MKKIKKTLCEQYKAFTFVYDTDTNKYLVFNTISEKDDEFDTADFVYTDENLKNIIDYIDSATIVNDLQNEDKTASTELDLDQIDSDLDFVIDDSLTESSEQIADENLSEDYDEDIKFKYMLLDRLRTDCDYFLGAGHGYEGHLWAGSIKDQITKMRKLYNELPEKPEWLSLEDIDNYEKEMTNYKSNTVKETCNKTLTEDDNIDKPYTEKEVEEEIRNLTNDFQVQSDVIRCRFIEELDAAINLLEQYYNNVITYVQNGWFVIEFNNLND